MVLRKNGGTSVREYLCYISRIARLDRVEGFMAKHAIFVAVLIEGFMCSLIV
jgi:hypothetical protein